MQFIYKNQVFLFCFFFKQVFNFAIFFFKMDLLAVYKPCEIVYTIFFGETKELPSWKFKDLSVHQKQGRGKVKNYTENKMIVWNNHPWTFEETVSVLLELFTTTAW